ncbi:MAG: ABC transporter permease [Oscillospiraceae bacterium]|jgi:simple sugar transport system permease protein|nr:ABC transporter permease [Oscillospiraceae bacterium]
MSGKRPASHSLLTRGFISLIGEEKRQSVTIPLFAILLSLLAGAIVILFFGKNPFTAAVSFLQGSGILPKAGYAAKKSMLTDLMSMINALTPMIFAALAVAVALKTGLFNIGISGQMLAAGFIATITAGYSALPAYIAMPLVLIIGLVCGGAVGAFMGWLKHRFNINEVVASIMLNYIFQYIVSFFINSYYVNSISRQSQPVAAASRLTLVDVPAFGLKMDIPLGFILTIPAALLALFLLNRTRLGYELRVVGLNKRAAKYAGVNVGKSVVTAMAISGALAGLAGVTLYLGYYNSIQPRVLSSVGFDSIAVCLLGNAHPAGILFSSLLITIISKGGNYMSAVMGVPQEIAEVITGLILLFSACGAYIRFRAAQARETPADSISRRRDGAHERRQTE